jgi:hypothetical protein
MPTIVEIIGVRRLVEVSTIARTVTDILGLPPPLEDLIVDFDGQIFTDFDGTPFAFL